MFLAGSGIQAKVSPQGSFARDTWISHEADLDIFARFPHLRMERKMGEKPACQDVQIAFVA